MFGWIIVFNATFNNISAISWQSVLLVEEARLPVENQRPEFLTKILLFLTIREKTL
jgi:hypothetical protein